MVLTKALAAASLLAGLALNAVNAASLPTISVVGSKFFDSTGKQFFVKGTPGAPLYSITGLQDLD